MRAFAVLSVIGYHFKIISGGFIGVDIFFVISGFLVSKQIKSKLKNNNFSFKSFFEARIRRIFPALTFLCIVIAFWGWFFDVPRHYLGTIRNIIAALFFVSNYAFNGTHGYFDIASETKALLHSWSLSVEAQFYLLLPILLFLSCRLYKNKSQYVLIAFFTFSLIFGLQIESKGFYSLLSRAWEFLAGALIASVSFQALAKYKNAIFLLLLTGLLLSVLIISNEKNWPTFTTLIPVMLAVFFIIAMENTKNNIFVFNRPMQFIGNISYSLYLWHWPTLVLANQFFENQLTIHIKFWLLVFIFFISYISWRYIERPFRNKEVVTSPVFIRLVIAILIITSIFGIFVIKTHGFPNRLKDYVARPSLQGWEKTPRAECFIDRKHNAPKKFCTYGASSKPEDAELILWGDSNANQYVTPLTKAVIDKLMTGLIATMASCQPYMPEYASFVNDIECSKFNENTAKFIKKSKNINIVVIGRDYGGRNMPIDATLSLVKDLVHSGKKVILLGPIPKPNMDVEYIWTIRQIKSRKPIENIEINNDQNVDQFLIFKALRGRLSDEIKQDKLVLINPLEKLCKQENCYAVRDGIAIFRDENHLTEIAAQNFESDFKEALDKLHKNNALILNRN